MEDIVKRVVAPDGKYIERVENREAAELLKRGWKLAPKRKVFANKEAM
jgi:hypothetical protein